MGLGDLLRRRRGAEPSAAPAAEADGPAVPRVPRPARARAAYDGATTGHRAGGWKRTRLDANGELTPAVQAALRGVARELDRNNPWAQSGANKIAEHMVGTGITFQVLRDGKLDEALSAAARGHLDTASCDAAGLHDLYGLQLQAARTIVVSGGVLLRRRWRRPSDRLPLPFQLQLLEPDYIDPTKHGPQAGAPGVAGPYAIHGIQFSPIGKREGYWLYSAHPGAARTNSVESALVPASEVAHVFRADRPEQEHGATWFAPVIVRLKDFGDYEDAQLTRQKLAAAFAGFIYDKGDGAIPGIEEDEAGLDFIESGTLSRLAPGEEVTFSSPPSVDGYIDFTRVSQRAIAAGLGVPYELLTGDLSQVSFISGRFGRLNFNRSVSTWQWLMFIPRFCGAVERWLLEALELAGYDIRGVSLRWTPPKHEMLDPATEVPANRDAIRSGQKTWSQMVRENGDDPELVAAELAEDMARFDRLGLILDCDPRLVTQVGNSVQPREAREAKPSGGASTTS